MRPGVCPTFPTLSDPHASEAFIECLVSFSCCVCFIFIEDACCQMILPLSTATMNPCVLWGVNIICSANGICSTAEPGASCAILHLCLGIRLSNRPPKSTILTTNATPCQCTNYPYLNILRLVQTCHHAIPSHASTLAAVLAASAPSLHGSWQ